MQRLCFLLKTRVNESFYSFTFSDFLRMSFSKVVQDNTHFYSSERWVKTRSARSFLRGVDHLLLAGMRLTLWRGLLWQQWLSWWKRAHLFSLVWPSIEDVWARTGARGSVWEMYIYADIQRGCCRWPLHLCTSVPERGPALSKTSSFQPKAIYSSLHWTNERELHVHSYSPPQR